MPKTLTQRIYDLTPPLTPFTPVWPGDTPVSREVLLDIAKGDPVTLSTIRATVHLGAHADGPNHYGLNAPSIAHRSLDFYLGPCQLIHAHVGRGKRITISDITCPITAPRVLFATCTFQHCSEWNDDFAAIHPDLIDYMYDHGVMLVGIDTPSVDLMDSKDLPTHKRILSRDMAILEGLVLTQIPEGIYELIALPLPLVDFDASPVRAILRTLPEPS